MVADGGWSEVVVARVREVGGDGAWVVGRRRR